MRYVIFRIPTTWLFSSGGWDDLFYRTDDLDDARLIVQRDPANQLARSFPDLERRVPEYRYQIIDLQTGKNIT